MVIKELLSKSEKELQSLIENLKAELFQLRWKNKTGQLDQSHKIKLIKKDIARAFTALIELADSKKSKKAIKKPIVKKETKKKEVAK